jgi:hypothetical protein
MMSIGKGVGWAACSEPSIEGKIPARTKTQTSVVWYAVTQLFELLLFCWHCSLSRACLKSSLCHPYNGTINFCRPVLHSI